MKKSEIKDLYNQIDEALGQLRPFVMLLPYVNGEDKTVERTLHCARLAEDLFKPVKAMCDYMIDDGSCNMTERLQSIKDEAHKIELEVAEWTNSYKQTITNKEHRKMIIGASNLLCLNCRAIINNIKDVEDWADNKTEPHPKSPNIESGEIQGSGKETPPEALKMENLPTIFDDEETKQKEQRVFYKAIKNKWMKLNESGNGYIWDKTKGYNHLAYMCGRLYCDDKIDLGTDGVTYIYKSGGRLTEAAKLKELFGGVDVGQNRSNLFRYKEPPKNWRKIDNLFKG